jgi:hypothetical protein
VGEGNENLVCSSPWDFKRSFTCRKILRHGTYGFIPHPKEGVLRTFIALKIHRIGRVRTRNLWVQWQAHYTTKATYDVTLFYIINSKSYGDVAALK